MLRSPIIGLKDSKQLSKKQREQLVVQIEAEALAVGLGWVSAEAIDAGGITAAVKTAMAAALQAVKVALAEQGLMCEDIVIDGSFNFLPDEPLARTLVKADVLVPAVSAASIVAKVARDRYMAEQDSIFPEYGFGQHVGYGTAVHLQALRQHGVTRLHRKSFKPVAALLQ